MHALTRMLTVAAAVLPLLWISVAFSQTPPLAPLDPTIPSPRSLDCYERLPTETVNLSLRDAATPNTLRLLAQSYKVNMVVTDDVKGSVTLDGVSLTVNEVDGARFGVNVIPVTQRETNFGRLAPAARVNLEIDMLARYLARLMDRTPA